MKKSGLNGKKYNQDMDMLEEADIQDKQAYPTGKDIRV